jgi:hypothetical protein
MLHSSRIWLQTLSFFCSCQGCTGSGYTALRCIHISHGTSQMALVVRLSYLAELRRHLVDVCIIHSSWASRQKPVSRPSKRFVHPIWSWKDDTACTVGASPRPLIDIPEVCGHAPSLVIRTRRISGWVRYSSNLRDKDSRDKVH